MIEDHWNLPTLEKPRLRNPAVRIPFVNGDDLKSAGLKRPLRVRLPPPAPRLPPLRGIPRQSYPCGPSQPRKSAALFGSRTQGQQGPRNRSGSKLKSGYVGITTA